MQRNWIAAAIAASLAIAPGLAGAAFNVRDYGATGGGAVTDTRAVEAAIAAAAAAGGGDVAFPAGRYLCGTIHLRSRVSLRLENGAAIVASPHDADFDAYEQLPFRPVDDEETTYFHRALLAGDGVYDIAITGPGLIDGNRAKRGGPKTIALKNCRHITIRDITVAFAPNYAISLLGCQDATIDSVNIVNALADGIDPDCSQRIQISNCRIDSHDDAICPKSSQALGRPVITEDITVTNCVMSTDCNCFKLGTESRGGFRNIAVSNCVMVRRRGGESTSGIAIESVDGAVIDGIVVSNITMREVPNPIFVRLGNRGRGQNPAVPGSVANITITNVTATGAETPSHLTGIPGSPLRGIALSNLRITMEGGVKATGGLRVAENAAAYPDGDMFGELPAFGLYVRHADGLTLDNVEIRAALPDARPAAIFDDARALRVSGFRTDALATGQPAVWLNDCVSAAFTGCGGGAPASPFARVSGARSAGIALLANDFGGYARAADILPGVPRGAVTMAGNHAPVRRSAPHNTGPRR